MHGSGELPRGEFTTELCLPLWADLTVRDLKPEAARDC